MNKSRAITLLIFTALTFLIYPFSIVSHPASYYATSSQLSSGKWIKIRVKESGIAQISNQDLKDWGFSDPSKVKIFGYGGEPLKEKFSEIKYDDIQQIPAQRTNEKIIFYAKSGSNIRLTSAGTSSQRFATFNNTCSEYGYYLLTDKDCPILEISKVDNPNTGTVIKDSSLSYAYHEKEEINIGSTGKQFLGEDFTSTLSLDLEMALPAIQSLSPISILSSVALAGTEDGRVLVTYNGQELKFTSNGELIHALSSVYNYYNLATPSATFIPEKDSETAKINIKIVGGGKVKLAKLDMIMLAYTRKFIFDNGINQFWINHVTRSNDDKIEITSQDDDVQLWDITDTENPFQYELEYNNNINGAVIASCSPQKSSGWAPMVAFKPNEELNKVEYVADVANQDLHAMAVPDMIIISPNGFLKYAQEIADLHRDLDGMDVAVIEESTIFNEFSSGTPDVTAYRMFAKMLWDKDPVKFKNILLFGTGSFDNRDIKGVRSKDRLLTYQSKNSTDETDSYTSDSYFTYLDDKSGVIPETDIMCVGIGRMPVSTADEAANAVKKLKDYINNTSQQSWRNEALLITDRESTGIFSYQAEGIQDLFNNQLGISYHFNKVYADAFALNKSNFAEMANAKTKELFQSGQSFVTYIGHGGPNFLTNAIHLWGKNDVKNTTIKNIPFMTLATCDVARFDSDTRGIAELMFHQPDGGVVGCLASSRSVYATENDELNRAFITEIYTPLEDGKSQTLGVALQNAKNSFTHISTNKLNYNLLCDPALRLNYPKNKAIIATIDDNPANTATISPLKEFTASGYITNVKGNKLTDFNGNIIITIYDLKKKFGSLKSNTTGVTRDSYIENDRLAEAKATVTNGEFTVSCIVPKECNAINQDITMAVYAIDTESQESANGLINTVKILAYDSDTAINDEQAPIIKNMYLNSPQNGYEVNDTPTLFVEIEDESGINHKNPSLGNSISLILDKKTTISGIDPYITFSGDNKSATLEMELDGLTEGKHTLELRASDISNNRAYRAVSFYYTPAIVPIELNATLEATRDKVIFDIVGDSDVQASDITIYVTDIKGNLVWKHTATSIPYEWNLIDIEPGIYSYYGSVATSKQHSVTQTKKIVILEQ